jgi:hypothetical protein
MLDSSDGSLGQLLLDGGSTPLGSLKLLLQLLSLLLQSCLLPLQDINMLAQA